MQVDYSTELLRDVGGFLVEVQPTTTGPTRVASSRHCTIVLMDGVPASWSRIPDAPYMITAIEVYKARKEIPKEFARYTWGKKTVCWWRIGHTTSCTSQFAEWRRDVDDVKGRTE